MGSVRLPWFLSGDPDLLELLGNQMTETVVGMRAFAAWSASGDEADAQAVRDAEHAADQARRTLAEGLQKVLVPPLEPEELYTMSERLDVVIEPREVRRPRLRGSRLASGRRGRGHGYGAPGGHRTSRGCGRVHPGRREQSSRCADDATHCVRKAEKAHRAAMVALKDAHIDDAFTLITTYEAYRGYVAVGEAIVHVAHRIWYAMLRAT